MFWILSLSYWVHLLTTVIWLGGMALMALVAWPALRKQTLVANQWIALQKSFVPWGNLSLILLLVTGFIQMTNDSNYSGFMVIDSTWAWAILAKHIAFIGMVIIWVYVQAALHPAMERTRLLHTKRPERASDEISSLTQREIRLLWINLGCAVIVLACTAVATAV